MIDMLNPRNASISAWQSPLLTFHECFHPLTVCVFVSLVQGRHFSVIVTEGRPDETGLSMARALDELRIPVTVVLDCGVGYAMERWAAH